MNPASSLFRPPVPGLVPAYPWVEAPPGTEPFDKQAAIPTPVANGVETIVLQFTVPDGFNGVILGYMNIYTNPSFLEGSGQLIWRIRASNQPKWDYGNIQSTRGSVQEYAVIYGGIVVNSRQPVTYSVIHAVGSPLPPGPGTNILCALKGYWWPINAGPRIA